MNSEALDNLVKTKVLKAEPADQAEFDGLLKLGTNRWIEGFSFRS